ncbi:hypothetical protein C8R44DRAFT_876445 [Mycena epipterygia]|nr:hypothetical protein C8R44DRAFT_876445 [Mycena epipterygia]
MSSAQRVCARSYWRSPATTNTLCTVPSPRSRNADTATRTSGPMGANTPGAVHPSERSSGVSASSGAAAVRFESARVEVALEVEVELEDGAGAEASTAQRQSYSARHVRHVAWTPGNLASSSLFAISPSPAVCSARCAFATASPATERTSHAATRRVRKCLPRDADEVGPDHAVEDAVAQAHAAETRAPLVVVVFLEHDSAEAQDADGFATLWSPVAGEGGVEATWEASLREWGAEVAVW